MLESVVSARGKVLRTNFSATSRVTRATKLTQAASRHSYRSVSAVSEILSRLTADLTELSDTANELKPSATARRQLDAELRDLITRTEALLRDLDPIPPRHPQLEQVEVRAN